MVVDKLPSLDYMTFMDFWILLTFLFVVGIIFEQLFVHKVADLDDFISPIFWLVLLLAMLGISVVVAWAMRRWFEYRYAGFWTWEQKSLWLSFPKDCSNEVE